jgi:large conductance mechanosensitive channel
MYKGVAMWQEFKKFIARGNVVDLGIAVVMGAAFGKIVTSFVEGLLMPPLGLIFGRVDFASLFLVLDQAKGTPVSLAEAKAKGIPVFAYGQFLNDVINFLIIAFVIFLLVRQINRLKAKEEPAAPQTRECPYCLSTIPLGATRCAACTSELKAA